ncbi:hypothetical protein [Nesterenkonia populi]|uniref:hypothetical protein n=1 Tax=Nesterenkonia populi TaxID=1591087 RepID=UPI0011BF537D|nr:hypothetical protein [Nesterenkonia populi]
MTSAQATRLGQSPGVLRRTAFIRLRSGVYVPASTELDDDAQLRTRAEALLAEYQGSWISHRTAARLSRAPLPRRLSRDSAIHLSVPAPQNRPRREGVVGHRAQVRGTDVVALGPLLLSSPARMWRELAHECSVEELTVLGDWLVRHPYPKWEGRNHPYSTVDSLRAQIVPGMRGASAAREALTLIRVGSDSPTETEFRLALLKDGLPEPQMQVSADPSTPCSPKGDLGYLKQKIVIQYEGATHFTPEQAQADQRRDNVFLAEGWVVLRLNRVDRREGFRTAVQQVRALLTHRS